MPKTKSRGIYMDFTPVKGRPAGPVKKVAPKPRISPEVLAEKKRLAAEVEERKRVAEAARKAELYSQRGLAIKHAEEQRRIAMLREKARRQSEAMKQHPAGGIGAKATVVAKRPSQNKEEYLDFDSIEKVKEEPVAVAPAKKQLRKSPFLASVIVDKRPLSAHGKAEPTQIRPVAQTPSSVVLNSTVPKKNSKVPIALLLLITVVLGVAVGAAVYFLLFQGQ